MRSKNFLFPLCGLLVLFFLAGMNNAKAQQVSRRQTERWHGFEKVDFLLDGIPAYYVKPRRPLPGNPWVWRAHFPGWHITIDSLLLERGFYIAYINTNDQYGAPKAMMTWDRFYRYLTEQLSFAKKPALEGVSRGGLYVYGWAKRNPDKVSCIYAEAPVCDFKSWPGGKGAGRGDAADWKQLLQVYGFSEQQAMDYNDNPLDHLEGLAAFKVPVLHVISLQDQIVPPAENTFPLVQRYTKLGGPVAVYPMTRGRQELQGHHFEIAHPDWWAKFIQMCSCPVKDPLPYADYFEMRNGISRFYAKAKEGRPVTVAFLGGSITHNPGWRNKTGRYLQERFPSTSFRFIAAGIPSLGSLPHAFRLQRDVLDSGQVDLLFVEAAVNDRVNGTDSLTQLRDLEGIVRHAKKANPGMDIVFMSFADPDKLQDYEDGKAPVAVGNHERVATHYGLPSVNLAREVYDKIQAGEFSWEDDFKNLHPSPFGQELYFQTIKALLNACFEASGEAAHEAGAGKLPSPLNTSSFDKGMYVPVSEAKPGKGWKLVADWRPADHIPAREGFTGVPVLEAVRPGAELSLPFTGTAVGMAITSGPDAGKVACSIDGKPFRETDLYTQWSAQLHLPWYILFSGNLKDGKHILRLRVSADKNPASRGNACRIVYFLVNR